MQDKQRSSNRQRRLQAFETGHEDLITGGWVRVLASAEQVAAGLSPPGSRF